MLVISSPSGAGKTSVAKAILEKDKNISLSISATTRSKRLNEEDGIDYQFMDQHAFLKKIAAGHFLEYARVFDHYYGTPKTSVENHLSMGKDVLFDIDWQGTQQLQAKCQPDLVSIFILPPSLAVLENRLRNRQTDSSDVIERRMRDAIHDISHFAEYDYAIINYDLDKTVDNVYTILKAERLKRHRQVGMVDFVNEMRIERLGKNNGTK